MALNFESNTPSQPHMHQKKQMPFITSTLIRDVYLTPKWSESPNNYNTYSTRESGIGYELNIIKPSKNAFQKPHFYNSTRIRIIS